MRKLKYCLILSFLLLLGTNLFGQEMDADKIKPSYKSEAGLEDVRKNEAYQFKSYLSLEDELAKISDYDTHYLGDEVAKRLKALNNLYVNRREVAVGFGDSHTSFIKPDILNAIYKIDRFYKKAVRKDNISKKLAEEKMTLFLEVGLVLFYESDSENFEKSLRKNSDPEILIQLFEKVEVEQL